MKACGETEVLLHSILTQALGQKNDVKETKGRDVKPERIISILCR